METITVETDDRLELLDITGAVQQAVPKEQTGTITVFSTHTTAGIAINEAESALLNDIHSFLGDVVADSGWEHDRLDGNADSHLRATLVGPSETIPVENGEMRLGTWQSVLLVECDGPRTRTIRMTTA